MALELHNLSVGVLRQHAATLGVAPALVEQARDGDDPKQDLIRLIVSQQQQQEQQRGGGGGGGGGAELEALSVGELRQQCAVLGTDPARVELARDSDDPKSELIALLLELAPPATDASALAGMSVGALRQRCAALGANPARVELARDSDDPKRELIALLLELAPAGGGGPSRAQLQGMSVGELRQMAVQAGVGPNSIDAARDGDDPKADLIELILGLGGPPQPAGGGMLSVTVPAAVHHRGAGRLNPAVMHAAVVAGRVSGRLSPTHEPEPESHPAADGGGGAGGTSPGPIGSPNSFRAAALVGRLSPTRLAAGLSSEEAEHEIDHHAATVIQTEWRGHGARVQFISRRRLHHSQLEAHRQQEEALAAVILEDLLDEFMPEIAPAFLARAVPAACASMAAAHVVKTRSKHSGPEAVADLLLQEYVDGVLRTLCTDAIGELVDDHFFDSAANAIIAEMVGGTLAPLIVEEALMEMRAQEMRDDLVEGEISAWMKMVAEETLKEFHGADSQEAIKQDNAAAEELVEEQLLHQLLQRAMSEVVRSQANNVLTDEVVEQLLDTTLAVACVDRAIEEEQLAASVERNVVLEDWHDKVGTAASVQMMVGRLDTLVQAWGDDCDRQDTILASQQKEEPGGGGGSGHGRQRNVQNVFAQAKAMELQRSEAALREWLEKEHSKE